MGLARGFFGEAWWRGFLGEVGNGSWKMEGWICDLRLKPGNLDDLVKLVERWTSDA